MPFWASWWTCCSERAYCRLTGKLPRPYAPLVGQARAMGHLISVADAQIAAIAAVHGFTVVTRNTAPFVAAGIPVVNPWELG